MNQRHENGWRMVKVTLRLHVQVHPNQLNSRELKISWFVNCITPSSELHLIWFLFEELCNWVEHILQVISCVEALWFGRYESNNENISLLLPMIKPSMSVLPVRYPREHHSLPLWLIFFLVNTTKCNGSLFPNLPLTALILRIRVKQESNGTLFTYSISLWENKLQWHVKT